MAQPIIVRYVENWIETGVLCALLFPNAWISPGGQIGMWKHRYGGLGGVAESNYQGVAHPFKVEN